MNRNQLKYLAALAMFFDHLGYIFISIRTPFGLFCRIFGRLTAPIMCYFLAEGFHYTSSRGKYLLRLGIFALIAQPAYSLAFHNAWFTRELSMLYTLFLCFAMLWVYDEVENPWIKWPAVLALIALCHFGDWMVIAPLWVLCFHVFRDRPVLKFSSFALVGVGFTAYELLSALSRHLWSWKYNLVQLAVLLAIPLLLCYNGQKGRGGRFSKWFFYVFYPAHLFLFAYLETKPILMASLLQFVR